MKVWCALFACLLAGLASGFSMSMRNIGITDDIHQVACSLNDIFQESFEFMIGSLGKHGVYYLPELKRSYETQRKPSEEKRFAEFSASNGWMKYPVLKAAEGMRSGALRKYRVPLSSNMREVLLVCVECLKISAQAVNYCYEANYNEKNVSGTITSGPVVYTFSLEMRITQKFQGQDNEVEPSCNITMGGKSLELSETSSFRSEIRGLQTLNFLADSIEGWVRDHFNSTVKAQLEKRLLMALNKTFTKHDVCEEFINQ